MPTITTQFQQGLYVVQDEHSSVGEIRCFRALDTGREAEVAIFELPSDSQGGSGSGALITIGDLHERTAIFARFRHPAVNSVLASFTEDDRFFLVTEPAIGTDLARSLDQQQSPFSFEVVAEWADSILDVLFRLHTFRPPQVHGAVWPSSILLNPNGSVSLMMAAALGTTNDQWDNGPAAKQQTSLTYSALEQLWPGLDAASQKVIMSKLDEGSGRILRQNLDARTDIYSLGATFYHLITGMPPLDALERSIEVIDGKPDPLRPPKTLDPAIPREISDVIMKSLEIRREFRFDSAAVMRQVLRSARLRAQENLQVSGNSTFSQSPASDAVKTVELETQTLTKDANHQNYNVDGITTITDSGDRSHSHSNVISGNKDFDDDLLGIMSSTNGGEASPFNSTFRNLTVDVDVSELVSVIESKSQAQVDGVVNMDDSDGASSIEKERNDEKFENAKVVEPDHDLLAVPDRAAIDNGAQSTTSRDEFADASSSERQTISAQFEEESGNGGRNGFMALAAAAGMLLVLSAAGWVFLGPANASPAEPAIVSPNEPELNTNTVVEMHPTQLNDEASQANVLPVKTERVEEMPVQKQIRPEPVTTAASAPRPKKQVPETSPSPARKRSVTVDDLINDN